MPTFKCTIGNKSRLSDGIREFLVILVRAGIYVATVKKPMDSAGAGMTN
jgi:hypothetical protein